MCNKIIEKNPFISTKIIGLVLRKKLEKILIWTHSKQGFKIVVNLINFDGPKKSEGEEAKLD